MTKEFVPYQEDTKNGLVACAKWLERNAEQLAEQFYDGCRDWSVEFSAGKDGIFHNIAIKVNKIDRDTYDAYRNSLLAYEELMAAKEQFDNDDIIELADIAVTQKGEACPT